MKLWNLQLDYDIANREEVEEDVKKMVASHPDLGAWTMEQSKSGHWHVIFPKSELKTFEEALAIAKESKADKDWLELSEAYQCFALVTDAGKSLAKDMRLKKFVQRHKKEPVQEFKQPVILVLDAETWDDHGRLRAICESITTDKTWEYKEGLTIHDLKAKIKIGCQDVYQAKRRVAFLEKSGVKFQWEIVQVSVRMPLREKDV